MEFVYLVATIAAVFGLGTWQSQIDDIAGYEYLGCFRDAEIRDLRVMKDHEKYLPELTIESCLIECISANMIYFGLEQINLCYCGRDVSGFEKYGNSSNCMTPCDGNTNQTCGGQFAIDVFKIEINQCPELNPPLHGNVHQDGDRAWFDCVDGYRLRGSKIIHCNRTTFEWTMPASPICYKTHENRSIQPSKGSFCSSLRPPINGKVIQTMTTAWFECLPGYCLRGTNFTNCNTSTYQWDGPTNTSCLKCTTNLLYRSTTEADNTNELAESTEAFRLLQEMDKSLFVSLIGIVVLVCTFLGLAFGLFIGSKIILRRIEEKISAKSNDGRQSQSRAETQLQEISHKKGSISSKYNSLIYDDLSLERNTGLPRSSKHDGFIYEKDIDR